MQALCDVTTYQLVSSFPLFQNSQSPPSWSKYPSRLHSSATPLVKPQKLEKFNQPAITEN
jgi:hypothetical protein